MLVRTVVVTDQVNVEVFRDVGLGVTKPQKKDGIYRAERRHASTHLRQRTEAVTRATTPGGEIKPEPAKAQLLGTRLHVVRGWNGVANDLARQGEEELALE